MELESNGICAGVVSTHVIFSFSLTQNNLNTEVQKEKNPPSLHKNKEKEAIQINCKYKYRLAHMNSTTITFLCYSKLYFKEKNNKRNTKGSITRTKT